MFSNAPPSGASNRTLANYAVHDLRIVAVMGMGPHWGRSGQESRTPTDLRIAGRLDEAAGIAADELPADELRTRKGASFAHPPGWFWSLFPFARVPFWGPCS